MIRLLAAMGLCLLAGIPMGIVKGAYGIPIAGIFWVSQIAMLTGAACSFILWPRSMR